MYGEGTYEGGGNYILIRGAETASYVTGYIVKIVCHLTLKNIFKKNVSSKPIFYYLDQNSLI